VTEAEWLTSDDPEAMARAANEDLRSDYPHGPRTARKRTLFGAACCRLVWPHVVIDERCRKVVEYVETKFEQPLSDEEEEELFWDAKMAAEHPEHNTPLPQQLAANLVYDAGDPAMVIGSILRCFEGWASPSERSRLVAHLLRDIVGNPFRPATLDPAWRTSTVLALASQMYGSRDFGAMPILADALQDAGCDTDDILDHCRGPGPHVRGCWVVDLVLGKS